MRERTVVDGVTVNAVAGTHVVTLGMDLTAERRKKCLGFAIQREDRTEDELIWLRGLKTFEETDPGLGPGESVSSREHPFQTFQWADYSAKPDHDYVYRVIPLYGTPEKLTRGPHVDAPIRTEPELAKPHSIFFNRGAIASQEYARRFLNIAPDKLEGDQQDAAYRWLSRGLREALLAFIARATGPQFALHGALYEFKWPEVLDALGQADARGADMHIVYDGIPSEDAKKPNEDAIAAAGIGAICEPYTQGRLMHNKFLVLSKNGKPQAVWTGSTNISENGLFGQLNVGHIVDDRSTASAYLDYWQQLSDDSPTKELRVWVGDHSPPVAVPPPEEATATLMSPRSGFGVLESYAAMGGTGGRPLFMTFAFGMDERFRRVYEQDDGALRFALMEKEGNGPALKEAKEFIRKLRKRPNVVVAVGKHDPANSLDRWQKERADGIGRNVDWVHTKFMLVDPLSDDPIVVTGSANFSENSTNVNDENMLVIRGDARVADIYLGEFMRSFSHHSFREALTFDNAPRSHLLSNPAAWQARHFDPKDDHFQRRTYFAQSG